MSDFLFFVFGVCNTTVAKDCKMLGVTKFAWWERRSLSRLAQNLSGKYVDIATQHMHGLGQRGNAHQVWLNGLESASSSVHKEAKLGALHNILKGL